MERLDEGAGLGIRQALLQSFQDIGGLPECAQLKSKPADSA